MSTKPFGFPKVPTPGTVIVTPVPEGSLTDHDSRTVRLPPINTEEGLAVKEAIVGAGHEIAVTVVCAVDWFPQPFLAVRK
jgi:hypothetical protein